MSNQQFPSDVPVCGDTKEKNEVYEEAKDGQYPFLAVIDEDDMPGWRVLYIMDPTGEGRKEWYVLSDNAIKEVDEYRDEYEQYIQQGALEQGVVIEQCTAEEGGLHGLSKADAQNLASRFADIVWDTDNWEKKRPEDAFKP